MDPRPSRAERLPALYRSILEVIGELERRGDRAAAVRARAAATLAYRIWDDAAERRLTRLHSDLLRSTGMAAAAPARRADDGASDVAGHSAPVRRRRILGVAERARG
jgi:hypothetical protein